MADEKYDSYFSPKWYEKKVPFWYGLWIILIFIFVIFIVIFVFSRFWMTPDNMMNLLS